jgi:hypothetical protein
MLFGVVLKNSGVDGVPVFVEVSGNLNCGWRFPVINMAIVVDKLDVIGRGFAIPETKQPFSPDRVISESMFTVQLNKAVESMMEFQNVLDVINFLFATHWFKL